MTGFQHSIAGGQGNLVVNSFQSPDFIPGVQGWQVTKDGNVEFNSGTFRGTVTGGEFKGDNFIINKDGAFFYSDIPGKNTLSVSLVPGQSSAVDPYGNIALAGTTEYIYLPGVPIAFANNTVGLTTTVFSATDMTTEWFSHIAAIAIQARATGSALTSLELDVGGPVVIDQWHTMALANGWVNNIGFGVAKYRLIASPPNTVEIIAAISGNTATNNIFTVLPVGYRPVSPQGFSVGCTSAADTSNGQCDTFGNLQIANVAMPVAQTFFIHAVISLDA